MPHKFKLKKVIINGLPGFESGLELDANKRLTTLIGPNGSGKSTSLAVIASAIKFLNSASFDKLGNTFEYWLNWSDVILTFDTESEYENKFTSLSNFGSKIKEISFTLQNKENKIFIGKMMGNNGGYALNKLDNYFLKSSQLVSLENKLLQIKNEKDTISQTIESFRRSNPNHPTVATQQKRLDEVNSQIKDLESQIQVESIAEIDFSPNALRRDDIKKFIDDLKLPLVRLIDFGETKFSDIDSTIKKISEIRGGNHPDAKYDEIKDRLRELLQQDPHFYNQRDKNKDFLTLNGVDYQKASTGTKICLYYFSLIYETYDNDIILWDEPENGLHPTRRYKLLELILKDTRQFIIATHSTELAPIFNRDCDVIRTSIEYRRSEDRQYISFKKISDKKDAFAIADELGLNPAKLLFTANVAIWVEGPSDMIFWRKALSLHPKGKHFIEGFDYTFVLYGGKCISHLTALETNEKLDILSVSSHPIFIVDSDISDETLLTDLLGNIKEEAKRIYEIFKNDGREPGSSLFLASHAREMENYFPISSIKYSILQVARSITEQDLESIKFLEGNWKPTEKYYEMIERKFTDGGLGKKEEDGKFHPKAKTRWDENNKTTIVKYAVEDSALTLEGLRYNCKEYVDQMADFIKRWQM